SQGYGVNTRQSKATRTWVINSVGDLKANQPREEQHDFLADGLEDLDSGCDDLQLHTTSIFKADHVYAFDLDYDEVATANAIFMARLSPAGSVNRDNFSPIYDSNILFEVPHYDTYHEIDMLNPIVQETKYSEHLVSNNDSYDELTVTTMLTLTLNI
nr:hypothetical protein [Tanacetum cinerariifolium]